MATASQVLTGLVALLHVYFLVLEMFLWARPFGQKTFKRTAAEQEAGDIVQAAPGVIAPERLVELGELIVEPRPRGPQDIVVYKSVGIGLEDVALARLVAHRLGAC